MPVFNFSLQILLSRVFWRLSRAREKGVRGGPVSSLQRSGSAQISALVFLLPSQDQNTEVVSPSISDQSHLGA